MKKVIKGKMYDTDTATFLESWSTGDHGDFGYCREAIYRKKTGEFFIQGEGGPMSAYAEKQGSNCWGYGKAIIPLTLDEAKKWVERHCDGDAYIAIFGTPEE